MILCGYTGGYTELGGGEKFLRKIRNDVEYKRLTPATHKRGGKFSRTEKAVITNDDSGITGGYLLNRILERFRHNEYHKNAAAIIVMDDTDCKLKVKQNKYEKAMKSFISEIEKINSEIRVIFFLADPEIEMWFYYDAANVFDNNIPLIRELNNLTDEYAKSGWNYDSSKDVCAKKYSDLFADMLNRHGKYYSKKQDGSEYLAKLSPSVIANKDSSINKATEDLKAVRQFIRTPKLPT